MKFVTHECGPLMETQQEDHQALYFFELLTLSNQLPIWPVKTSDAAYIKVWRF